MSKKQKPKRTIIHSLDQVPQFTSEDEEREWWAAHELAPELGEDVTARACRDTRVERKYRYVPSAGYSKNAAKETLNAR